MKLHVPLGQFPKPITQCLLIRFKDEFAVYPLLKPGLYFVRRSTQTLLRKCVYTDNGGLYSCVGRHAYLRRHAQKRFAYHFREMDLFYMPRKRLRIRRGSGLLDR